MGKLYERIVNERNKRETRCQIQNNSTKGEKEGQWSSHFPKYGGVFYK